MSLQEKWERMQLIAQLSNEGLSNRQIEVRLDVDRHVVSRAVAKFCRADQRVLDRQLGRSVDHLDPPGRMPTEEESQLADMRIERERHNKK